MALVSGHRVEDLKREEMEKQAKDFKGYTSGLVRLTPGPWVFPKNFLKFADKYYNFKFRPNDVLIATFPKCGTTWTQEIVWTMRNNPNLDNPEASIPISAKVPFMEFDSLMTVTSESMNDQNPMAQRFQKMCPGRDPKDGVFLQMAECIPAPRSIKTHLSFSLLPPSLLDTCKVVYVARNPKDVVVSYHHHSRLINVHGYAGTFEDFVQYFVDDDLMYGGYAEHLKEAWARRNHPNLHFIFYENMKADPVGEIKRLDSFMGTKLTEQQMEKIAHYTSFSEMKKRNLTPSGMKPDPSKYNPEVIEKDGGFFRKGEAGDWKNKFTPELSAKVDAWTEKNLKNMGLDFKYSI